MVLQSVLHQQLEKVEPRRVKMKRRPSRQHQSRAVGQGQGRWGQSHVIGQERWCENCSQSSGVTDRRTTDRLTDDGRTGGWIDEATQWFIGLVARDKKAWNSFLFQQRDWTYSLLRLPIIILFRREWFYWDFLCLRKNVEVLQRSVRFVIGGAGRRNIVWLGIIRNIQKPTLCGWHKEYVAEWGGKRVGEYSQASGFAKTPLLLSGLSDFINATHLNKAASWGSNPHTPKAVGLSPEYDCLNLNVSCSLSGRSIWNIDRVEKHGQVFYRLKRGQKRITNYTCLSVR